MQVTSLVNIRDTVETAMSVYLTSEQPRVRDIMLKAVQVELRRNSISRLWCSDFKVYLLKDENGKYEELALGFDTMNISLDGCCPQCGEHYRKAIMLHTYNADRDNEEHIYGCKCGYVYKILCGQL